MNMDILAHRRIEVFDIEDFPGERLFIQLSASSHIADTQFRRTRHVFIQTTRYCADALTLARVDKAWLSIGIEAHFQGDGIGIMGRSKHLDLIVITGAESPTTFHALEGSQYLGLSIKRSLLEHAAIETDPEILCANTAVEVSKDFRRELAKGFLQLLTLPESELDNCALRLFAKVYTQVSQNQHTFKQDTQKRYVQAAVYKMINNSKANQKTTVSDMALAAACSQRTLQYAFQRHLNMSPKTFIDLYRLTDFKRRTILSKKTEITIADEMGFSNLSRLRKNTRKFFK
jgi:AraC-like DNA-binding protein